MTNSFGEFAKAKMFLVIGSNMTEAHPVAATFLKNAVQNGAQLILVDPAKTKTGGFRPCSCANQGGKRYRIFKQPHARAD